MHFYATNKPTDERANECYKSYPFGPLLPQVLANATHMHLIWYCFLWQIKKFPGVGGHCAFWPSATDGQDVCLFIFVIWKKNRWESLCKCAIVHMCVRVWGSYALCIWNFEYYIWLGYLVGLLIIDGLLPRHLENSLCLTGQTTAFFWCISVFFGEMHYTKPHTHTHTDTQQLHLLHCHCSTSDIIGEGVVCAGVGAVFYSFELNGEAEDCQLLVLAIAWLGHIAIIFWGYFWCAERRRAVVWVVKMQTYKNRCFVCDCILAGSSLALALAYICYFAFIITFCLWSTYGGVLASQPACLPACLHLDRLWKKQ